MQEENSRIALAEDDKAETYNEAPFHPVYVPLVLTKTFTPAPFTKEKSDNLNEDNAETAIKCFENVYLLKPHVMKPVLHLSYLDVGMSRLSSCEILYWFALNVTS